MYQRVYGKHKLDLICLKKKTQSSVRIEGGHLARAIRRV